MRPPEEIIITSNTDHEAPGVRARTMFLAPSRRLLFLSILAVPIGLASGFTAYGLVKAIGLLTNVALFHRVEWDLPNMADVPRGPGLVIAAVLGALVVSVMARWAPQIRGHGTPEAMEAVLADESRIPPRTALAKPLSAVIAIGTGGPFGAEGPIIVTGGALGSLLGQVVPVSPEERKILLGAGAAAGMAAIFGTPLAAVILAIELLLFEYSARAFIPLTVAASLAAGMHSWLFGSGPLFVVPPQDYAGLGKLPFFAILGLACGLLAVLIARGLFVTESAFRRSRVNIFWHPMIGAVGFSVIGLFVPRSLGVGYSVIDEVLTGKLALATVAAVGVAKLVSWWIAIASGTSGGTLAPILLMSACFGTLIGEAVEHLVPGLDVNPAAFALVAMAATLGAAIGATFASIVFLFELTRQYQIILPLMLASVIAQIVSSALLKDTVMTEKLSRRGVHVEADFAADALAGTYVGEVMRREVDTLDPQQSVADARKQIGRASRSLYPLVDDDGAYVATVARRDLLDPDVDVHAAVGTLPHERAHQVGRDTLLLDHLGHLLDDELSHLVVVEDGHLVGIVTPTEVVRARVRSHEYEQIQPGVHLSLRRRARSAPRDPDPG